MNFILKSKKIKVFVVFTSLILSTTISTPANAWIIKNYGDDFEGNMSIVQTFYGSFLTKKATDNIDEVLNDRPIALSLVCLSNSQTFGVGLYAVDYQYSYNSSFVRMRLNNGAIFSWSVNQDQSATPGYLWFDNGSSFVKKLSKSSSLAVQFATSNGTVSAKFKTSNLAPYLKKIRGAGCRV